MDSYKLRLMTNLLQLLLNCVTLLHCHSVTLCHTFTLPHCYTVSHLSHLLYCSCHTVTQCDSCQSSKLIAQPHLQLPQVILSSGHWLRSKSLQKQLPKPGVMKEDMLAKDQHPNLGAFARSMGELYPSRRM